MTRDNEARRSYSSGGIRVFWEPRYCIHSGNCVRGLPAVFRPAERPWILADEASADEIARVVARCPTGALHFERLDGGPAEEVPAETTVSATKDGPLLVHGEVELRDGADNLIRRDTRVALCRCGASANKPFCDNSHLVSGFRNGS